MNLYQDDYPSWVDSFMDDVTTVEDFSLSSDEDIWSLVRDFTSIPHVGNAYCLILFGEMSEQLSEKYENHEFLYDVNAMATTFTVNGDNVTSYEELVAAMKAEEPLSISEFIESNKGKKQLYLQYVEYIADLNLENINTDALLVREHNNLFQD